MFWSRQYIQNFIYLPYIALVDILEPLNYFLNCFLSLSGLKLKEPVVVSSPDGPLVVTPADLTNSSFQPVVTSVDGTPTFATADFATFEVSDPVHISKAFIIM